MAGHSHWAGIKHKKSRQDNLRSKIASAGRKKYFKLFNELKTTKYIIDKSLGKDVNLY